MTAAIERRSGADAPQVNPRRKKTSFWPAEFYSSAVGKKWVMALTGVGLMGFVFVHMIGNLKMFLGRTEFDHYAEGLRSLLYPIMPHGVVLWGFRIGLIVMFFLHIASAISLTRMNQRARPIKYQSSRDYIAVSFASRTMRWTGIIVLAFIIYHLLDLTFGTTNPDFVSGEPYHNVVESFSVWPVAIFYIIANVLLGIHIWHGAWSMFQSLGINNRRFNHWRNAFAVGIAALITVGNVSFPVAVLTGVIG